MPCRRKKRGLATRDYAKTIYAHFAMYTTGYTPIFTLLGHQARLLAGLAFQLLHMQAVLQNDYFTDLQQTLQELYEIVY